MYRSTTALMYAICLVLLLASQATAASDPNAQVDVNAVSAFVGDIWTGSTSTAAHRIILYDDQGFRIFPGVNFEQPFSCKVTCGICHQVQLVKGGWHFSAGLDANDPGRPGEPWIYWDCPTGTQIPLSLRPWPGTFEPNQIGLSDWWFTRIFGRHMPGAGVGDRQQAVPDPRDRWQLSGSLEANCLACHDSDPAHDQAQYGVQVGSENFRWAATATTTLGTVEGAVRDLPDTWQPGDPGQLPTVRYDSGRFLPDNKVPLQITRRVPNQRCLFCHSVQLAGTSSMARSQDVHLAAGMQCVDCHRNGLDHRIARGYEGQPDGNDAVAQALTCRGCHIGQGPAGIAGPYPRHKGLPNVHLERLACTACHSGPVPSQAARPARTSRAHALGTSQANASPSTLPHILMPVFARAQDGKIYPHRLMWPAYWAQVQGDNVRPLDPQKVRQIAGPLLPHPLQLPGPDWPDFTAEQVAAVLQALQAAGIKDPAYISGGMLYQVSSGTLVGRTDPRASCYMWPMAHDVRPARSALGAGSCQDCHHLRSPFLFGKLPVDGPLADPNAGIPMLEFQGLAPTYSGLFAWTFVLRPYLKLCIICASLVAGLLVAGFAIKAILAISKAAAGHMAKEKGADLG